MPQAFDLTAPAPAPDRCGAPPNWHHAALPSDLCRRLVARWRAWLADEELAHVLAAPDLPELKRRLHEVALHGLPAPPAPGARRFITMQVAGQSRRPTTTAVRSTR